MRRAFFAEQPFFSENFMRFAVLISVSIALTSALCFGQSGVEDTNPVHRQAPADQTVTAPSSGGLSTYMLGPEDLLTIRVMNVEELGDTPYPVDLHGDIDVPRIGKVHAAGLSVEQLEAELTARYREFLQKPVVTVAVAEFHSQPVSVLGEVTAPGVHQIRGRRTLLEIISEASGLKVDAGSTIQITRRKAWGAIPLPSNKLDPSGDYYTASVNVQRLMAGKSPQDNVAILPNDVITVPKADLVYVVGAVKRAGGFVLSEKTDISILEALSLAEGLDKTAGPKNARILRPDPNSGARHEIPVDIKKLLAGKSADMPLAANDILFIPNSTAKVVTNRTIDALVQAGTGLAIYHPF